MRVRFTVGSTIGLFINKQQVEKFPIRFLEQLEAQAHFNPEDRLLLALSGGIDSMALLHLLHSNGFQIAAAHVNYNFREESSQQVEELQAYCEEQGIPFHLKTIAPDSPIEGNKQAWARTVRYAFFDALLEKEQYDYILTAHHADDQLETVLLNFVRGAGLDGLSGMKPKSGNLLRPFLAFKKDEISAYVFSAQIPYWEDSSNTQTGYNRNKLRHEIIPKLRALLGHDEGMHRTIANLQDSRAALSAFRSMATGITLAEEEVHIDLRAADWNAAMLFQVLQPYGFNQRQAEQLLATPMNNSSFNSSSHKALFAKEQIWIRPVEHQNKVFYQSYANLADLQKSTFMHAETVHTFQVPQADEAIFELQDLKFPLMLRSIAQEDNFKPMGMHGKNKSVRKHLKDVGFSLWEINEHLVLTDSEGTILWIPGVQRTALYTCDRKAKDFVLLRWLG